MAIDICCALLRGPVHKVQFYLNIILQQKQETADFAIHVKKTTLYYL